MAVNSSMQDLDLLLETTRCVERGSFTRWGFATH